MRNRNMVFISHRQTDASVAEMIRDFLLEAGVPNDQIFCSSLPGNDVHETIGKEVKTQLRHTAICILVLSENYYKSAYCLNEAGIAWYNNNIRNIPIGMKEIGPENMLGFLDSDYKLRRLDNDDDISYVYDEIQKKLGLKNVSHAVITRATKKLIKRYNKYSAEKEKVGQQDYNENINKINKMDLEKENERLRATIAEMKDEELREYRYQYISLRDETIKKISYYAYIYTNPVQPTQKQYEEANDSFRDLASRFDAITSRMPKRISDIPNREELEQVKKALFGLSNGLYIHPGEDAYSKISHNDRLANEIREILSKVETYGPNRPDPVVPNRIK